MQKYFVDPQHLEILGDPANEQYVSDCLFYKAADADTELESLKAQLSAANRRATLWTDRCTVAKDECDKFKAVLSGAQYQNIDGFTKMPVVDCKSVGAEVATLTISMQKERDTLRDVLALLAPDLKAMAILYAQKGDHLRSQALANICKSVGVL